MKPCPSCGYEVESLKPKCPKCGFELMTPREIQESLAWVRTLRDYMHSTVDKSPAGLQRTANYLDNILKAIGAYQSLLSGFLKKHEEAMKKPKLLQDQNWYVGTNALLLAMLGTWKGMRSDSFSQEALTHPPPGSFGIQFELRKVAEATETLVSAYARFTDHNEANALEESKSSILEIMTHLDNATAEMEDLRRQMAE